MKCEFKLVFNDNQYCPFVTSELYSIKTICYRYKFLELVISDFKNNGYNFNHIAEMNIIATVDKLDMSYEFYITQNMHEVEWKLNAVVNKNKILFNELDRIKRHPLIKKSSYVPFKK